MNIFRTVLAAIRKRIVALKDWALSPLMTWLFMDEPVYSVMLYYPQSYEEMDEAFAETLVDYTFELLREKILPWRLERFGVTLADVDRPTAEFVCLAGHEERVRETLEDLMRFAIRMVSQYGDRVLERRGKE